ncbi:hypothetical protein GCM10010306_050530 [Streptomyces umbrinus]|nr:hypothetical protein GCM10010306_050530 [Streptomyces umbrinus]GHH32048.1 hypothetical protein GCM10018775_00960 [Streptomyces umbrinus]
MQARGQLAKFPRRVRRERERGQRREPVRSCGRTASEALCGHADSPLPRPVEKAEKAARHACWGSRRHGSGGPYGRVVVHVVSGPVHNGARQNPFMPRQRL